MEVTGYPVMFSSDDNWSIVDYKGKVLARDEYNFENDISPVYGKVYWVKGNKTQLYNISSPQKPITDDYWNYVTAFNCGRSIVSKFGKQIELIDDKGNVISKLPKNIISCDAFSSYGIAVFKDKDSKYGWIGLDGTIKGKGYLEVLNNDNTVLTKDEENSQWILRSFSGEKINTVKGTVSVLGDGLVNIFEYDGGGLEQIMDYKGKIHSLPRGLCVSEGKKGYFVVYDYDNGLYGLIDKNDEEIIRCKYNNLKLTSDGKALIAQKKNKGSYGVIDKKGKTLVDFEYEDGVCLIENSLNSTIGLVIGSAAYLYNSKGSLINKNNISAIADNPCDAALFIDLEEIVEESVKTICAVPNKTGVPFVAKKLGMSPSSNLRFVQNLGDESIQFPFVDVEVNYSFDKYIVQERTHMEKVSDGWFTEMKTVSDGFHWNNESHLKAITVTIDFTNLGYSLYHNIDYQSIDAMVANVLKKNGFTGRGEREFIKRASNEGNDSTTKVVLFNEISIFKIICSFEN